MRICGRALGIFCCILPSVLACAASGALMLPLAAAVFIHEAAHILVLRLVGGRLRDFRAAPFGLRLEIDESTLSVGGKRWSRRQAAVRICFAPAPPLCCMRRRASTLLPSAR